MPTAEPMPRPGTAPSARRCPWAEGLLALLVGSYIVIFSYVTVTRYQAYELGAVDLATFDQTTWLLSQGQAPYLSCRGFHAWANHAWLFLYLLAPFYWLGADARFLLVFQTVALGMGAVPIYSLAWQQLRSRALALLLALAYLTYRPLHFTNLYDFHVEAVTIPFYLAAFAFAGPERWGAFLGFGLVPLLLKEQSAASGLMLGLYALSRGQRRVGGLTAGINLVWLLVIVFFFSPSFAEGKEFFPTFYGYLGETGGEILRTSLAHPSLLTERLFNAEALDYLFRLLAPLALLPLLSPGLLALAGPQFVLNMLSDFEAMQSPETWYVSYLIPFIFVAAIQGCRRVLDWAERIRNDDLRKRRNLAVAALCGGLATTVVILRQPLAVAYLVVETQQPHGEKLARARLLDRLVSSLPRTVSISAPALTLPHLDHREQVFLFPNPLIRANVGLDWRYSEGRVSREELQKRIAACSVDYFLADLTDPFPLSANEQAEVLALLRESDRYALVFEQAGLSLFRRRAPSAENHSTEGW